MTITVAPARNELTANAGQTIFNYTFKIFSITDLNVYITPAGQNANDSTDLTTAYTVLGVGDEDGGTITLTTGATLNDLITIVSNTPSSRTTDYQNNGDFRPDTVNADFDRVVSLVKKIEDVTNRGLVSPQSKQGPKPLSLPDPVAGELLRWIGDLSGLENVSLNELPTGVFPVDRFSLNYSTLAEAIADATLQEGDILDVAERSAGVARSGGKWVAQTGLTASVGAPSIGNIVASTGTAGLFLKLVEDNGVASVLRWGAIGDGAADDEPAIKLALNSGLPNVLFPKTSTEYKIVAGLEPPNNTFLWGEGPENSQIRYFGTATAISFGEFTGDLNRGIGLQEIKVEVTDKDAKIINLRAAEFANFHNVTLEALFQPFDNTRTNIGIHIDGANVSSFFNRFSNVKCNHVHECYRIQTTGTLHSTTQFFDNCTANGDQITQFATDDKSIGYNFGPGGTLNQEGQGTVITGGNVENCNTAFLIGNRAGSVTVDGVRIEITPTGTAWKFDFVDGCDPWTIKGVNGLGTSYMEANSGIRNFDSNKHILLSDDQGSIRMGGFDAQLFAQTFLGIGGAAPSLQFDADSVMAFRNQGDATGKGSMDFQAGRGSGSFGSSMFLYGAAHATEAGNMDVAPSSQIGSFRVRRGRNGAVHLEVDRNFTANETTLLLFDITAGTLQRVSIGVNDSGGAGFRVLRIPN